MNTLCKGFCVWKIVQTPKIHKYATGEEYV